MKRSRNHDVNESLKHSDRIAEEQVVLPTKDEKACISSYCALSLQCKKIEAETKNRIKDIKPDIKTLRTTLMQDLKKDSDEILQLPQRMRKTADQRAVASGLPTMPPYIRLVRNNKDLTITQDVVNEAITALTENDILEAEGEGYSALINAITNNVRRLIRSFSEQIKLTESVPRTIKAADVPFASEELSKQAIDLHFMNSTVLLAEKQKREAIANSKEDMESKIGAITSFFERGNLTHQRVVIENKPYNLCRRITIVKSKVTLKILEAALTDLKLGVAKSKKDIASILISKRTELIKFLLSKMGTLPTTSKTIIHLQRVAESTEEE